MKKIVREIWDPIFDFYVMRLGQKGEIIFFVIVPIIMGTSAYIIGSINRIHYSVSLNEFYNDILNQLITVIALFVTFCMAYLSILLTSSSKNVDELKSTKSESYKLKGISCSLYQVNANEVTYVLLSEIFFMIFVFFQKMISPITLISFIQKVLLCIDIAIFIHILLVMLVVVKNMYFSFWRSK